MKRMRVIAQIHPIEQALFELYTALDTFLKQPRNAIYGVVHLHDGSTDMGFKAPWGDYSEEYDVNANAKFTADGDRSFITINFGQYEVGGISGDQDQATGGPIEFMLDLGSDTEEIGTAEMPLEAVAKAIHDKIETSDLPDEYAVEQLIAAQEAAEEAKRDSRRDEY